MNFNIRAIFLMVGGGGGGSWPEKYQALKWSKGVCYFELLLSMYIGTSLYNEDLETMKITLLYQFLHYIRVKNTQKYKELGPAK